MSISVRTAPTGSARPSSVASHRVSTKEDSLAQAKDFAEDWYLELKGKFKRGEVKSGKTFKFAAAKFIDEFEVITQGQRSPIYVAHHRRRLENYLIPFLGARHWPRSPLAVPKIIVCTG